MHRLAEILFWPLLACVSMGLLHGYAGLHVLRRGVIFVDLALAQMAALGAVVGMVLAPPHDSHHMPVARAPAVSTPSESPDELEQIVGRINAGGYVDSETHDTEPAAAAPRPYAEADEGSPGLLDAWPTIFALGGALLLAFGRIPGERVPHEAIIGIVYVVASAATVLLLSKSPHGHEEMEQMLTGKLLFVDRREVLVTGAMYAGLGLLHLIFFRPFLAISTDASAAEARGVRVRLWDCLFYAMFALMVTRSVAVGGVLVVFSFLIIPGACASLFAASFKSRILWAWLIATIVSLTGVILSALGDLPTGATMVATFGLALIVSILFAAVIQRSGGKQSRSQT